MSWSNSKIKVFFILSSVFVFSFGFKINTIEEIIPKPLIQEKVPEYVSMTFAGDIMLDRGVKKSVIKNFDGDYSKIFENLGILKDSDIVFANLEGTASDKGKNVGSKFSFHMDPSVLPAIKNAGINIVSVANNHVGDWQRVSYIDSLTRLKENNILYTGGGMNKEEAEQPTIIQKNGIKIGFLAFSDKGPNWLEVSTDKAGLLIADRDNFDEIIQNASKQVDYLVVSFHFGEEYQKVHNKRQEYLAHKAVDDGAKLVIGHHPHVVEDFEVYSRKGCIQSSCVSYIAYSLGNFIFDQSWSEPTMQGLLLNIKLKKDGSMTARKNTFKLNNFFQPSDIVTGQNEEIIFQ